MDALVQLGDKYRDVLNGHRQCILPFPKSGTGGGSKTTSARAGPSRTNSLVMQKSNRGEPWDDNDWHSDKEYDDEPPMPAPTKSRAVSKKTAKTVEKMVPRVANSKTPRLDKDALRLRALTEWRKRVCGPICN